VARTRLAFAHHNDNDVLALPRGLHQAQVARRAVQQPQAIEIRPQLVGQIWMRRQERFLIGRIPLL
jgi:hypothetical protein